MPFLFNSPSRLKSRRGWNRDFCNAANKDNIPEYCLRSKQEDDVLNCACRDAAALGLTTGIGSTSALLLLLDLRLLIWLEASLLSGGLPRPYADLLARRLVGAVA